MGAESLEREMPRGNEVWYINRRAMRVGHLNMYVVAMTIRGESRLLCSHERGNKLERR